MSEKQEALPWIVMGVGLDMVSYKSGGGWESRDGKSGTEIISGLG